MKPVFVNWVIPDSHADPLDSRMEFHANGPYNPFIMAAAKGSTLTSRDAGTETFFEKMVEISYVLKDKLRMTLFVSIQVQATFGPDLCGIRPGPVGLGRAPIRCTKPGLVFAGADPVAVEVCARSLPRISGQSPFFRGFSND